MIVTIKECVKKKIEYYQVIMKFSEPLNIEELVEGNPNVEIVSYPNHVYKAKLQTPYGTVLLSKNCAQMLHLQNRGKIIDLVNHIRKFVKQTIDGNTKQSFIEWLHDQGVKIEMDLEGR